MCVCRASIAERRKKTARAGVEGKWPIQYNKTTCHISNKYVPQFFL